MKNVVITGATSFIGVSIIKECVNNCQRVIAVVRPNSKNLDRLPESQLITIIEAEMDDFEDLINRIDSKEIDVFYHLAWDGTRIPYRDDVIIQEKNYYNAINAMEAAKKLGCNVFIGAGSQAEYGICKGQIDEKYSASPITEYGKAKLRTYETLKELARESNIKFIWTRIFSVYGIFDYQDSLIMSVLDKMKRDESIPLTQCIQNWDYIYIEDLARAMYLLGDTFCMDGIYNIASGESRQLKDFVMDMKEICKSKSELLFGAVPYNSEGIVSFEPNVDKLKQNLGWSCKVKFEEGIEKILKSVD